MSEGANGALATRVTTTIKYGSQTLLLEAQRKRCITHVIRRPGCDTTGHSISCSTSCGVRPRKTCSPPHSQFFRIRQLLRRSLPCNTSTDSPDTVAASSVETSRLLHNRKSGTHSAPLTHYTPPHCKVLLPTKCPSAREPHVYAHCVRACLVSVGRFCAQGVEEREGGTAVHR